MDVSARAVLQNYMEYNIIIKIKLKVIDAMLWHSICCLWVLLTDMCVYVWFVFAATNVLQTLLLQLPFCLLHDADVDSIQEQLSWEIDRWGVN